MWTWIVGFVAAVNVAAFLYMGLDKLRAARGWRRTPELHFYVLAAATGAIGVWLATLAFRHKTIKTSFRRKLVLATLVNVVWIWLGVRLGGS